MGCGSSKIDDLPAVILCRDRCAFLEEAVRERYALSEAHTEYLRSLKSVGISIDRFFNLDPEAILNLPEHKKGEDEKSDSPAEKIHHIHSHSDSGGSHINFHSDDSDDEGGGSANSGPINLHEEGFMNMNYMKNQTTPSVIYTHRPMSPETVQLGESSSSSYFDYPRNSNSHNPPLYNPNYSYNSNSNGYQDFNGPSSSSSSKAPPPPPPSSLDSSGWDFLNPFESFEKYYPRYTPSREEEEVMPELEDEEEEEVVKQIHGGKSTDDKPGVVNDEKLVYNSVWTESHPVEYEVHMVDKKVVDDGEKDEGNVDGLKAGNNGGFNGDLEVVKEIQKQFERASECGSEIAKLLEVGKLPYKGKHSGGRHVSSKTWHLPVVSLQPSTSKSSDNFDFHQDVDLRSRNLSSTLHKLHLWEKKLYEEVKVEEKMRVLHEQKSHKLKRLDEKGADFQKVDATRTLVKSLSTKIRIAIQGIDKISIKINTLRDEDLWPQLKEFIHGLTRMWKSMLDCHHHQCRAIVEAQQLDAIALRKHSNDAQFEATRQLEHDLIDLTLRFSYWIGAQKGYIRALHNWLMKCLLYVPEETSDGPIPFSPGRIGAPAVFVICNHWWQSLDGISEKEVVDSMRDFATNVLQLWDRDKAEIRQHMVVNKDDRKIKSLDREDQKIQKEIQALDKRVILSSGEDENGILLTRRVVYQSETSKVGSLQTSLQRVLEAMEKFTENSVKVYDEILQRIEEDSRAREHEKVS